jgi:hypothetical protein
MTKLSTKHSTVTTYRLSFCDSKRFLGEAIFDMDDSAGAKTVSELVKEATRLGINPGGEGTVDEYPFDVIPERYKGQLITDEELLMQLDLLAPLFDDRIWEAQRQAIVARFGEEAALGAIYGWQINRGNEFVRVATKIRTEPRYVLVSESYAPYTEIVHDIELYACPDKSDDRAPASKRDLPPQLTQAERVQLYHDALNKLMHAFECLQCGWTYGANSKIKREVDDKHEQDVIQWLIDRCSQFARAGASIKEADRELARIVRDHKRD